MHDLGVSRASGIVGERQLKARLQFLRTADLEADG